MNKILLKTSGRTASHLLLDQYALKGMRTMYTSTSEISKLYEYEVTEKIVPLTNIIVQCHLKTMPVNTQEWDLIINTRSDIVGQTLSSIIARKTNTWHSVADISEPIDIDKRMIKEEVIKHIAFKFYMELIANYLPWKSTEYISMEQILEMGEWDRLDHNDWQHLDSYKSINHADAVNNLSEVRDNIQQSIEKYSKLARSYAYVYFDTSYGDAYDIQ